MKLKTCGSCQAGILIMNDTQIQACDECKLFETDEDAADAVSMLLKILGNEYRGRETSDTVADAFDRISDLCIPPDMKACPKCGQATRACTTGEADVHCDNCGTVTPL